MRLRLDVQVTQKLIFLLETHNQEFLFDHYFFTIHTKFFLTILFYKLENKTVKIFLFEYEFAFGRLDTYIFHENIVSCRI